MKMINEASVDDAFNLQIGKIQDAIIKLEGLLPKFQDPMYKPVRSQRMALEVAESDLRNLQNKMFPS
jgi:hypothetical protein